ncbi:hypothetical protein KP509_39G025600 [Ceratopteris richardii]|uniref:TOD1/MUCI70 glycosyltransferase-like domain-containing protein n=1 Tax=Ceratopteris richardii TaxID=49495 RepID=A0A8T2Q063_CERRI|nr:hypothetical protein KP509_39G025600 [Ceratopteris richardii]
MASYTQGGSCYSASLRAPDHHGDVDLKKVPANGGTDGKHSHRFSAEAQGSSRTFLRNHHHRVKRSGRSFFRSGPRVGVVAFLVLCIVSITIFGGYQESDTEDYPDKDKVRALMFGKVHVQNEELLNRDSRYWERDDRIRDYDPDIKHAALKDPVVQRNESDILYKVNPKSTHNTEKENIFSNNFYLRDSNRKVKPILKQNHLSNNTTSENTNLDREGNVALSEESKLSKTNQNFDSFANYNQKILDIRVSAKQTNDGCIMLSDHANLSNYKNLERHQHLHHDDDVEDEEYHNLISEIDQSKALVDKFNQSKLEVSNVSDGDITIKLNNAQYFTSEEKLSSSHNLDAGKDIMSMDLKKGQHLATWDKVASEYSSDLRGVNASLEFRAFRQGIFSGNRQDLWMQQESWKSKHRHRSESPCEIKFLETTEGLAVPETSSQFENFSLSYVEMEYPQGLAGWEPRFAGHQTLAQRNQSFKAEDQTVHCGFVQAAGQFKTTGFDLSDEDIQYLHTCRIGVSSCIFGGSDNIRSPRNRMLTGSFKKDVCFVMFVDQSTLNVMQQEGQEVDKKGHLGPWKIVLVRKMPYTDARRVGKIPKFLTHRLFPSARYSIWLDSKLRLQSDPVLILEYFLWRAGHEYAISNHYDRHCVWEEVQQNKKLNKYNHNAIDEQFFFYQADGLTRFNASDPEKLLPSNVPEGSFIIRAHTPMSNLFSCLWFNEVDRFTSRDQLSFAYTYMKFLRTNPNKKFHLNMFKDCERKSIAKLFRHRKGALGTFESHADQEAIQ